MGKDKTDTDIICPNAQNDRKKSIDDKENSIETNKSKSKPIIKVRKDLTEVLEDENTNDSNTSTNSKSNKSSSSHNSSSTSKEDISNNINSAKSDLKSTDDTTNSKSTGAGEENTVPKFRIASNNSTEFKLRIVPLEKLLEKPPKVASPPPSAPRYNRNKKENLPAESSRRLPQRRSKPVSFIELSDSEEDDELILSSSSESAKGKKSTRQEASKGKVVKKASDSDSEEEDSSKCKKSKTTVRKTSSKPVSISSDSEEVEAKKRAPTKKSEDSKAKKIGSKRKSLEQSSEPSVSEEEVVKKSSKNKKPAKEVDSEEEDSEEELANKSLRKKNKKPIKKADSEEEDSEEELPNKSLRKKSAKKTDSEEAESQKEVTKKSLRKKPAKKTDSEEEASEEEVSKNSLRKKHTKKTDSEEGESVKEVAKKSLKKKPGKKTDSEKSGDESEEEVSKKSLSKKRTKKTNSEEEKSEKEESRTSLRKRTAKKTDSEEDESEEATIREPAKQSSESSESEGHDSEKSQKNKTATKSVSKNDDSVKTHKKSVDEPSRSLDSDNQEEDKDEPLKKSANSEENRSTKGSSRDKSIEKSSEKNDKEVLKSSKVKSSGCDKAKVEKLDSKKKRSSESEADTEEEDESNNNSISDEGASKKITTSKRKHFEKSSGSSDNESVKEKSARKASRSSLSEKDVTKSKGSQKDPENRLASKRKSTNKPSSEEDQPKKIDSKNKSNGKPLVSDKDKTLKANSAKKSKAPGPPPSPSSIRRCVVRVKRSKLADFKDIGKNKSRRKMNGGTRSEKPSTSSARRRRVTSDDDSDFNYRRSGHVDDRLADHDYDGHDVDDDDNDSQKSSDSEIMPTRKRRVFRKEKANSNNSDSDFEPKQKDKKKRRRVRRNSSGDSDDDDDDKKKNKRKDIRKIMKSDDLNVSTKEAAKEEEERRKRIEERQKIYNQIYVKPDSAEVTELVLDFDPDTKKALLEVDKGLMKKLKPHQVTGVKFMWDACFETIKDAQEKPGSGCILAHCMGLGKTMQIVTLSHTLLANSSKTNVERVLIISPLSTLNNWAREFNHWIGFTKKRNIEIYDLSKYKDKQTRIFKLNEWFEEGGVCILGYDMYRILTNEKAKGLRKKQREQLQQSLVDPGPDLVVCDEGHLLKNEKTSISKAVTRMRTMRRIVLTGTPLQNNLKEYYCMIQFIKPNLLGTYKEYLNRFVNPITNGQYTDSTDRDIRLMKHRSHILHKLLEGCIQRRDYSVLAPYLPPKHEYVVYTTLSTLQQLLYEHYMVHQRDLSVSVSEGKGAKLFQDFQELRRIWTHPMNMRINSDSVIRKKILANDNDSLDDFICDDDNDEEDAASTSDSSANSSKSFASGDGKGGAPTKVAKTRNYRREALAKGEEIDSDIEEVAAPPPQDDPSEWWKRFVADKELNNINHSPKLVLLMRLLEQCEAIGDKLLVFSQSLQSLDTIEHFLSLIDSKTRGYEYEGDVGEFSGFWSPGTDYFRLDGSCSVESRESMCKKFNDTSNLRSRLFLISTRAGGLGINLVSANRVVIFDVSWNPSHDTQSIFRVYRFGQEKPCYIYRLIAMGTMEQKLYERQVAKQATAKRVIDEQQISRHYNQSDLQELYTYELSPSTPREIPILPKDRLFAELLTEHESLLFKYHEHDSLLENEESENLSAEERKAAWSEYEAEKTRTVQTAQYIAYDRSAYGQFGNASGSVTSNKIFGFRSDVLLQLLNMKIAKDHPEMTQNQVIQVVPTYLNELYSQMNSGDPTMYKDLLTLHATLVHPSGMYMNPLLYVNQNPQAAGYFQSGVQPANGMGGVPGVVPMMGAPMAQPGVIAGGPIAVQPAPMPAGAAAPGFDPNQVYEID